MKKWTLILGSFFLIISFQNCQKADWKPLDAQNSGSTDSGSSNDFNKTSASSFPILQMWDYSEGRTLDVDVATGHVAVYLEYGNERDEDRCLNETQTGQLQQLLSQAEVCEPIVSADHYTDRNCAMNYRAPYAVLVAGAESMRLGEKTNGCDIPTDLCGENAQALQDFVQSTLAIVDQQVCQ